MAASAFTEIAIDAIPLKTRFRAHLARRFPSELDLATPRPDKNSIAGVEGLALADHEGLGIRCAPDSIPHNGCVTSGELRLGIVAHLQTTAVHVGRHLRQRQYTYHRSIPPIR